MKILIIILSFCGALSSPAKASVQEELSRLYSEGASGDSLAAFSGDTPQILKSRCFEPRSSLPMAAYMVVQNGDGPVSGFKVAFNFISTVPNKADLFDGIDQVDVDSGVSTIYSPRFFIKDLGSEYQFGNILFRVYKDTNGTSRIIHRVDGPLKLYNMKDQGAPYFVLALWCYSQKRLQE